jgi:hypothetical protein
VSDYEEMLLCDGLEDALVGVSYRCNQPPIAVYDIEKIIAIYMDRDGMSEEEAREFFEFNVIGAWVGDRTPAFIAPMRIDELNSAIEESSE